MRTNLGKKKHFRVVRDKHYNVVSLEEASGRYTI
jgi:hypothetical protein